MRLSWSIGLSLLAALSVMAVGVFSGSDDPAEGTDVKTGKPPHGFSESPAASSGFVYVPDFRDPFLLSDPSPNKEFNETKRVDQKPWIPPPFHLSGTVFGRKTKIAIVHSPSGIHLLSPGDTLMETVLRGIEKDSVLFYDRLHKKYWWIK